MRLLKPCKQAVSSAALLLTIAALLWMPSTSWAQVEIESLGIGTESLLGGDLTDPEDDGEDVLGAGEDPGANGWNVEAFFASHEEDFEGGENAFNVFDNKLGPGNDKWCCDDPVFDEDPEFASPVWVGVELAEPVRLSHFTVSSANDVPDRDPTIWELQGSNDGENWDTIYRQDEDDELPWIERLEVVQFTLETPSPSYSFFRYIAFETPGGLHQIGEIELFGAAPSTLSQGLLAYWELNDNLQDSQGDSHGAYVGSGDGATFEAGGELGDGYLVLDGIDEFIEINPDNEDLFDFPDGEGFTVSAWFKVAEFTKDWQALVAKGEGNRWRIHRRGGESGIAANGGNADIPSSPTPVNDDEWHQVVLVSTPDEGVVVYIDCEVEGETAAPALENNDMPMMIGENPDALGRTWNGCIDDVAVWNRPLTEDEVSELWNSKTPLANIIGGGVPDADRDGMSDKYETDNGLDPNDAADRDLDKDGDGLTNLEEFNGTETRPRTLASKADTDEDGYNDKAETNTGTWVSLTDTGTNPLRSDTDKDGLADGVETNTGVLVDANNTGTNPLNEDTDGDGKKDGREVANNTNPHDPNDPPPPDKNAVVVAYWPLDSDVQDVVGDSHGEVVDGDSPDGNFEEGKLDGALLLDGISEFVEINPDNEDMLSGYDPDTGEPRETGFSVTTWFKVGAFEKSWQALVAKGEGNRWRIHRRGGESIMTGNGGNADVSAGSIAVDDDEWHFLALISNFEEGLVQLYVDGELEGESGAPNLEDNSNPMMIGENPDARGRTWNGWVDDLAFYSRALAEEEVLDLWNGGDGKTVGEVFLGLSGGLPFQITRIIRVGNNVTITWPSRDGESFIVEQGTDLENWEELTDGHPSGGEETSFEVELADPAPDVLYIRVRKEE